jgi:O-antigen ligase
MASAVQKGLILMRCFLFGLLLTIFLGLLDYYDLINLNTMRPWYFLAELGENYRFEHLTSVFGNPGWYAQYLVLGSPALLAILALRWQKKWKIVLLVSLMIVTEFCIILIYQRGGWLSYPLTLVIIWFCVYVLDGESKNFSHHIQAIKGSLLKIAITLPVTIAISLTLVYFTARVQPENRQQLSGFVQRAESITNVNDRLKYWEPAFLMVRLHPLFGPGVESFASQYEKLYVAPGHLYTQTPKYDVAPFYGSAHNLYFQTLAGKGILGLLSLFGVMLAAITLVWRGIFAVSASGLALSLPQRLLLMMTLAYTCALAIYGNVGEIFYSPNGYILFVLFFAASIGAVPATFHLSRRFRIWVLGLLSCAFVLHLYLEFGVKLGL